MVPNYRRAEMLGTAVLIGTGVLIGHWISKSQTNSAVAKTMEKIEAKKADAVKEEVKK